MTLRQAEIDSVPEYPVYFVLADGGASRSGYWVASVLSKLQDTSRNAFGRHLFCLSGASGGSVGNASFYLLLKELGDQPSKLPYDSIYLKHSRQYLENDFLTYTLSRMLSHDFFVRYSIRYKRRPGEGTGFIPRIRSKRKYFSGGFHKYANSVFRISKQKI